MSEKINKLQIRAKVLEIINSYNSMQDFESEFHSQNVAQLISFNAKPFILEILLKELISNEGIVLSAVKCLLIDLATLDEIEDSVWTLLKDKSIPDKKKENYLQLLRVFGGKIDVPALMDCLQDFESIVDEQTQGLLELATVNPEAQIDFLDFLFSLKTKEQLQLIDSLTDDFKDDELANVLSPCLRGNLDMDVKRKVISILANSKSYFAITPLKQYIQIAENNELKKMSFKALNQLKNDGIDIDNTALIDLRGKEVCKESSFHKAYLSQVDGCGNQGLIFSRIDSKKQITMFSVVINVNDGIIDCFGLYNMTQNDFKKVVTRFKSSDIIVPISASVAKYKLDIAEELNNTKKTFLPYEYICWKIFTADIEALPINYNEFLTNKITNFTPEVYFELYDTESFDSWFFEYDDNIEVQNLINFVLANHSIDKFKLLDTLENKIEEIYYKVYTLDTLELYSSMLKDVAFVFYTNQAFEKANIAMNLVEAIQNGEVKFLKDVIRRSILQYLANIVADEENSQDTQKNIFEQQSANVHLLSVEEAYKMLMFLEKEWS